MRASFAAGHNTIKADAVAAQQLHALKQHCKGKLKLNDVKEMFLQMRDGSLPARGRPNNNAILENHLHSVRRNGLGHPNVNAFARRRQRRFWLRVMSQYLCGGGS
jgi:hypothetical protein